MPSEKVSALAQPFVSPVKCISAIVAALAGTLPASSSAVMRHCTWPAWWCETEPAVLVIAANHRSVPIATAGLSLKTDSSSGVISEPPPTPVMPTMAPTPKPLTIAIQSMGVCSGQRQTHLSRRCPATLRTLYISEKNIFVESYCRSGIWRHGADAVGSAWPGPSRSCPWSGCQTAPVTAPAKPPPVTARTGPVGASAAAPAAEGRPRAGRRRRPRLRPHRRDPGAGGERAAARPGGGHLGRQPGRRPVRGRPQEAPNSARSPTRWTSRRSPTGPSRAAG